MMIQLMGARSGQRKKTRSERNNKHKKVMDPVRFFKYPSVEQAVVYSTLPQEYSTLTFRGEVVAGDGGVEERSEVMYCIEVRTYIYYKGA